MRQVGELGSPLPANRCTIHFDLHFFSIACYQQIGRGLLPIVKNVDHRPVNIGILLTGQSVCRKSLWQTIDVIDAMSRGYRHGVVELWRVVVKGGPADRAGKLRMGIERVVMAHPE